jgi:trimeric autotransporter adhesin
MRSMPGRSTLLALSLVCIFILTACCSNSTPVLRYLAVAPATQTIDAGATVQFTASAYYSDGTVQDQTSTVGWSTSSPGVATITPGGLATGVALGTTTITASAVGAQASATLTVNRVLQNILVTPANATVPLGGTQAYDALGTFLLPGGSIVTQDLSTIATWNSTNPNVTIDNTGLATAPGSGTGFSNITASFDGVTSNVAILSLGTLAVTGIEVTPAAKSIAVGNTLDLTVMEVLSNNTTLPVLSNTVTWAVSNCAPTGAATIADNGVNGLQIVVGDAPTTTPCTITATEGTFTATSTITVVTGTAHFAYLASGNSGWVNQYSVSAASTTPLAPLTPATVAATTGTQMAILNPSGLYAYTIGNDANSLISIYDIVPATGLWTERSGDPTVPSGSGGPNIGVIDPTGRYLYVIDGTANTINGFSISQTDGTLTPFGTNVTNSTTPSTTSGLNLPSDVLIDQTGQYLYVVNSTSPGTISAFTISPTDGSLTASSTPSYTVGNAPIFATISSATPATPYMYVPNSGDNTVSGFSIDPTTGLLTSLGTATPVGSTSLFADNAVVDPTGKYLYVVDAGSLTTPGQVFGFNIGTGGAIGSAIAGLPVAAGFGAGGIAIDPTGELLAIDDNIDNNITPYFIGAGGALTPDTPVAAGEAPYGIVFYVAP